jgi:hypothetical protein
MRTISGPAAPAAPAVVDVGAPAGAAPATLANASTTHDTPTCNGSTVSAIGRDDAARIWCHDLTDHMTSSTDNHGARTTSLDAARDLFTAGSVQYNAVATAWSAVGVS